jgi:ATP synthase protein I
MANDGPNLKYEILRQFGVLGSVGLHLVLGTFTGLAIGYFLDRAFGSNPWLTLLKYGFVGDAALRYLHRLMRRQQKG